MTEHRDKYLRRTQDLPTGLGLDLLVVWATEGPRNLVPRSLDGERARYSARSKAMKALRRLAVSLGVPKEQRTELEPVHGRDFGDLSDDLLNTLAWRARARGHVMPGCRARTPLTPVQADTLDRTVWGATAEDIAKDTDTRAPGVLGNLGRMRHQQGCLTTAHLVATAYRNHWLPDAEELRVLLTGRMVWGHQSPYEDLFGIGGRPPYKWTDNA